MNFDPGDVYWLQTNDGVGAGVAHPHVIIWAERRGEPAQTLVHVCALTTNLKRLSLPGNVLLEPGEANLPRQSVVEVAKVLVVDSALLGAYVGSLSARRVQQIRDGNAFVKRSFFAD